MPPVFEFPNSIAYPNYYRILPEFFYSSTTLGLATYTAPLRFSVDKTEASAETQFIQITLPSGTIPFTPYNSDTVTLFCLLYQFMGGDINRGVGIPFLAKCEYASGVYKVYFPKTVLTPKKFLIEISTLKSGTNGVKLNTRAAPSECSVEIYDGATQKQVDAVLWTPRGSKLYIFPQFI